MAQRTIGSEQDLEAGIRRRAKQHTVLQTEPALCAHRGDFVSG